jgi:hydrogenase maturation protease
VEKITAPVEMACKRSIVVGIGNPLLKDDRVGIEVVEALQAKGTAVETAVLYSAGFDLIEAIMGYDEAVIVDACQIGMTPGTILETTPEELFDRHILINAHVFNLAATLQTGRRHFPDRMPKKLKIIMVQVEDVSTFSTKCTPVVCHAIQDVVALINPGIASG